MENTIDYLKDIEMYFTDYDMEVETQRFIEEMDRGLKKETSSLKMIDTYIDLSNTITKNKTVMVMDAGGTNLRVANVIFDDNLNPIITNLKSTSMPGANNEITKDYFFEELAKFSELTAKGVNDIGFCFSYPALVTSEKDAILLNWTKGIKANGVVNEKVGSLLAEELNKNKNKIDNVVVLNDTVATLLGGKGVYANYKYDSYIGFIYGTGVNTCYIEDNRIYNLESGGYSLLKRGQIDILYDEMTNNKGRQYFEKMSSGKYLGDIIYLTILNAYHKSLISEEYYLKLKELKEVELATFSMFLENSYNKENQISKIIIDNNDRIVTLEIIDALIERAAKICAMKISAIILKTGKGKNIDKPFAIVCEGSTFFKLTGYKNKFDYYLKNFLTNKHQRYYRLLNGDNLNIIGSAIAVL